MAYWWAYTWTQLYGSDHRLADYRSIGPLELMDDDDGRGDELDDNKPIEEDLLELSMP